MNSNSDKAQPYSYFASVYDHTMQNVPFYRWASFLNERLCNYGYNASSQILEVASGTGHILRLLKPVFTSLYGSDISMPMLRKARKYTRGNRQALICADMVQMPFQKHAFDAAFCVHDSINYLASVTLLSRHLREMARILRPGALYIFDSATERNVLRHFHRRTFRETHKNTEMLWQNSYDRSNRMITSELFFTRYDIKGRAHRHSEIHQQLIYTDETIRELLKKNRFELKNVFADYKPKASLKKADLLVYEAVRK